MSRWATDPASGWIVPLILFTVHNLEEVLFDLPAWGREHFEVFRGIDISVMDFAVAVMALTLALLVAAFAMRHRRETTLRMQRLFLIAISLVFCWHIGVSLWSVSLQPGVVTSVLFLPLFVALKQRVPKSAEDSAQ